LTFDRDFGELIFHRKMTAPPGVAYFRFDPMAPEQSADYLLRLLTSEGIALQGKFTVVRPDQVRQRLLP